MNLSDEYEDIIDRYNERRRLRNMVARYRQRREGRKAAMREDAKWITIGAKRANKETGEPGHKGRHVLIDDEGEIISGAGGSLTGVKLKGAKSTSGEVKVDPGKVKVDPGAGKVDPGKVKPAKAVGNSGVNVKAWGKAFAMPGGSESGRVDTLKSLLKKVDDGSKMVLTTSIGTVELTKDGDNFRNAYGVSNSSASTARFIDDKIRAEHYPWESIYIEDKDGNRTTIYDRMAEVESARKERKAKAAKIGKAKTVEEAEALVRSLDADTEKFNPGSGIYLHKTEPFSRLGERCISVANTLKSLDDNFGVIEKYKVAVLSEDTSKLGYTYAFDKDTKPGKGTVVVFTSKYDVSDLVKKQKDMSAGWEKSRAGIAVHVGKKGETPFKMECEETDEAYLAYTPTHEYGHLLSYALAKADLDDWSRDGTLKHKRYSWKDGGYIEEPVTDGDWRYSDREKWLADAKKEIMQYAKKHDKKASIKWYMSAYGKKDDDEFFAESFASAMLGKPNAIGLGMQDFLKKRGYDVWK